LKDLEAAVGCPEDAISEGTADVGALEGGGLGGISLIGSVDGRGRTPISKATGRLGRLGGAEPNPPPGGGGGLIPISPGMEGDAPNPGGPIGGAGGREGGAPKPGGGPIEGMEGGGPGGALIGDIDGEPIGDIDGEPIGDIDGGLIGGASLKSRDFVDIGKSY